PSWPVTLELQQCKAPAGAIPNVSICPTAICLNRNPPLTGTGVLLEVWDPSPSWPKLFAPQQSADPSERRPQLYPLPAPMLTQSKRNEGGPAPGGAGTPGGGPMSGGMMMPGGGPGMPPREADSPGSAAIGGPPRSHATSSPRGLADA